jgi:hypothetical protein
MRKERGMRDKKKKRKRLREKEKGQERKGQYTNVCTKNLGFFLRISIT